jgi:transcriptional regulator with XRE-family HTH domain
MTYLSWIVCFFCYASSVLSADLLREARLRAGLTQAELGRRVGRHQSAIARWESGRSRPSLETLRELIRACGLELGFTIANYDDSYLSHINRSLGLGPAERITRATETANAFRELRPKIEAARTG